MKLSNCSVLVTGANGFIGKNLLVRLNELVNIRVNTFVRGDDPASLPKLLAQSDAVVHLAGENRPIDETEFERVNFGLTSALCQNIKMEFHNTGRQIPLILASSTQAAQNNPYGRSKLAAEEAVHMLYEEVGNSCMIFRLPGVFGKWCKPNYNSVVATFCHNISSDLPIQIDDPTTKIRLVYVDDVVTALLSALEVSKPGFVHFKVEPEYVVNLGELAKQISSFVDCRSTLMTERVGTGFLRALYATYLSYLPYEKFSYQLSQYEDPRGVFVEMLKTSDSGQFSYFTAHPGITRGGHYHHTKSEKFLVIKGQARFRFRHIYTGEMHHITVRGDRAEIVESVPGWVHDITNIGSDELVVMLWANEIFDRERPDTISYPITESISK